MADQHTVIQGSRRPDGTIRKEIRVRAGFRSEENTQVYKSRGTQLREQKESGLPPGLSASIVAAKPAVSAVQDPSVAAVAKQLAAAKLSEETASNSVKPSSSSAASQPAASAAAEPEDERAKELRKLKKKLRQIEEIEANVASGKLTNPTAEQRAKLEQKAALLSEIAALESQP